MMNAALIFPGHGAWDMGHGTWDMGRQSPDKNARLAVLSSHTRRASSPLFTCGLPLLSKSELSFLASNFPAFGGDTARFCLPDPCIQSPFWVWMVLSRTTPCPGQGAWFDGQDRLSGFQSYTEYQACQAFTPLAAPGL